MTVGALLAFKENILGIKKGLNLKIATGKIKFSNGLE